LVLRQLLAQAQPQGAKEMTREDIIRMAREAGAIHIHGKPNEFAIVGNDSIKAFATLVAAAERERIKEENQRCYVARGQA
jgi:hypothetical protein